MNIIIEPSCRRQDEILALKNQTEDILENYFSEIGLNTLDKIIVTDDDTYISTINKYTGAVNITNTNDFKGASVVITNLDETKSLIQTIFMKDFIYFYFLFKLCNPETDLENNELIFYHEIGHALDNQILFNKYGYINSDKIYNLNCSSDFRKNVKDNAILIWSEYFAERFASSFTNKPYQINEINLEQYINSSNHPHEIVEQFNHSYRVAYLFSHYISFFHCKNIDAPLFKKYQPNDNIFKYLCVFKELSEILLNLYDNCGIWNFDKNIDYLADVFEKLIILEREYYNF